MRHGSSSALTAGLDFILSALFHLSAHSSGANINQMYSLWHRFDGGNYCLLYFTAISLLNLILESKGVEVRLLGVHVAGDWILHPLLDCAYCCIAYTMTFLIALLVPLL